MPCARGSAPSSANVRCSNGCSMGCVGCCASSADACERQHEATARRLGSLLVLQHGDPLNDCSLAGATGSVTPSGRADVSSPPSSPHRSLARSPTSTRAPSPSSMGSVAWEGDSRHRQGKFGIGGEHEMQQARELHLGVEGVVQGREGVPGHDPELRDEAPSRVADTALLLGPERRLVSWEEVCAFDDYQLMAAIQASMNADGGSGSASGTRSNPSAAAPCCKCFPCCCGTARSQLPPGSSVKVKEPEIVVPLRPVWRSFSELRARGSPAEWCAFGTGCALVVFCLLGGAVLIGLGALGENSAPNAMLLGGVLVALAAVGVPVCGFLALCVQEAAVQRELKRCERWLQWWIGENPEQGIGEEGPAAVGAPAPPPAETLPISRAEFWAGIDEVGTSKFPRDAALIPGRGGGPACPQRAATQQCDGVTLCGLPAPSLQARTLVCGAGAACPQLAPSLDDSLLRPTCSYIPSHEISSPASAEGGLLVDCSETLARGARAFTNAPWNENSDVDPFLIGGTGVDDAGGGVADAARSLLRAFDAVANVCTRPIEDIENGVVVQQASTICRVGDSAPERGSTDTNSSVVSDSASSDVGTGLLAPGAAGQGGPAVPHIATSSGSAAASMPSASSDAAAVLDTSGLAGTSVAPKTAASGDGKGLEDGGVASNAPGPGGGVKAFVSPEPGESAAEADSASRINAQPGARRQLAL